MLTMSHRTADLPPLTGIAHVIRELRYHEAARQALAVVLIVLYTVTAAPVPMLVAIGKDGRVLDVVVGYNNARVEHVERTLAGTGAH